MNLKEEFEEKFCYPFSINYNDKPDTTGIMWKTSDNASDVYYWIESKLKEAKEEGFNAGCDYTVKKYGDGKTENQIRIEENQFHQKVFPTKTQQMIFTYQVFEDRIERLKEK